MTLRHRGVVKVMRRVVPLFFCVATAAAARFVPALADDLALCYAQPNPPSDGIAACTRLIQSGKLKGSSLAIAFNFRGVNWKRLGDPDSAVADFEMAIWVDPVYPRAHSNRAYILFDKGNLAAALAGLETAIRLDPKFAPAYVTRGRIYELLKTPDLARTDYEAALEIAPNGSAIALEAQQIARTRLAILGYPSTRTPAPTAPPTSRAESAQPPPSRKAEPSRSYGTGFFVTQDGGVLTNAHVVDGCNKIVIRTGTVASDARLAAMESSNDLALLNTDVKPDHFVRWRQTARQGEDVTVFGFPLSGLLASSGNVTTGNITALAGLSDDSRFLQISAPVQPGNSGGPVFDRSGNVVGVVVSKLNVIRLAAVLLDIPQNVNFAIKSSIALNFLSAWNVSYSEGQPGKELSTPDLVEDAKALTVQIVCER